MTKKNICPECKEELSFDKETDEYVCLNCGYFKHIPKINRFELK